MLHLGEEPLNLRAWQLERVGQFRERRFRGRGPGVGDTRFEAAGRKQGQIDGVSAGPCLAHPGRDGASQVGSLGVDAAIERAAKLAADAGIVRLDGADLEVRLYDMSPDPEHWREVARSLPGNERCAASPACTARRTTYSAEKTCGAPECRPLPDGSWLWLRSGDGGDGSDTSGFTANWSGVFAQIGRAHV